MSMPDGPSISNRIALYANAGNRLVANADAIVLVLIEAFAARSFTVRSPAHQDSQDFINSL
jgi:hypothetical protein